MLIHPLNLSAESRGKCTKNALILQNCSSMGHAPKTAYFNEPPYLLMDGHSQHPSLNLDLLHVNNGHGNASIK